MAVPSSYFAAALEPAITAVRKVLRDLEPREIPQPLLRVAAHGGRRLPPPLVRSALVELDRNDWLRGKTLEAMGDDADPMALAFVAGEPGWWLKLVDSVASAAAADEAAGRPDVTIADLEDRLAEARRRHGELRDERDRLAADVRSLRRAVRDREAVGRPAVDGGVEERLRRIGEELSQEQALRQEAESRLADVRRRAERRRDRPPPMSGDGQVRSVGFDDPVEVARRLDLEASALASGVKSERAQRPAPLPAEPVSIAVPPGIAPDAAESIEWLVQIETPATVIIDGYNVTYLMDPEHFSGGDLRRQLVAGVGRMRRRSTAPHRILVVFDSVEMETGDSEVAPGGVEVRFTAAHLIADDEIVALAAATSAPVVVISNDRELRDRAEAEGALTLWGTALAAWL